MYDFCSIPKLVKIDKLFTFIVREADRKFYFFGESHPFWEMVYVRQGSVGITADERVYTLKEGEMIFHKPMEFHRIWSQDGTSPKYCVFSFTAEGSALKMLEDAAIKCTGEMQTLVEEIVSMRDDAFVMKKEWIIEKVKNNEKAFLCVSNLERLLCLASISGEKLDVNGEKDSVLFGRAVSYLNENISDKVSVDELAGACFVSTSTIKKVFAKYVACGVNEFFTIMKVNLARKMLGRGMSVSRVSESLGFSNQFYFSSVFKKMTGTTPSKYKKSFSEK